MQQLQILLLTISFSLLITITIFLIGVFMFFNEFHSKRFVKKLFVIWGFIAFFLFIWKLIL